MNIPTYVIHYNKLKERKSYLSPLLKNAVWQEYPDRDIIKQEEIDYWYKKDRDEWFNRCYGLYKVDIPFRELKTGDVCCSLGHITSWRMFLENDNTEWALFLEDDVILCDDFYSKLHNIMEIKPKCDAMFLGGGFDHTIAPTILEKNIGGFNFILKDHPATNCLCSYMLHRDIAEQMLRYLSSNKTVAPIDFEVNFLFRMFRATVYHIIPMLCIEGSSQGRYQSVQIR